MPGALKFESTKIVMTTPDTEVINGSSKWDGGGDSMKRGVPLYAWPDLSILSPLTPTTSGGYRPTSIHQGLVVIHALYDKATARIIQPLVKGENLKTIVVTESGRAADMTEVVLRTLTLTDGYLEVIGYRYDERISSIASPGGFVRLGFRYTKVDLVAKKFDADLKPTGQSAGGLNITHGASSAG